VTSKKVVTSIRTLYTGITGNNQYSKENANTSSCCAFFPYSPNISSNLFLASVSEGASIDTYFYPVDPGETNRTSQFASSSQISKTRCVYSLKGPDGYSMYIFKHFTWHSNRVYYVNTIAYRGVREAKSARSFGDTSIRSIKRVFNTYTSTHAFCHVYNSNYCLVLSKAFESRSISENTVALTTGACSTKVHVLPDNISSGYYGIKLIGFADKKALLILRGDDSYIFEIVTGNFNVMSNGFLDSFSSFYETPSNHVFNQNLGPNIWVSFDTKWIFFVPKSQNTSIAYPKGLNSYYGNKEFITSNVTNYIENNTSYLNTSHTSAIRSALSNVYVQEIIFNKTSDKMIVLTNSVSGSFAVTDSFTFDGDSHNPDRMFAFVYQANTASWINVSSIVDRVNLWNSYNESNSLKRPSLLLQDNDGNWTLSWGKPAYNVDYYISYTNTIW
jgi:hypothetical protein